MKTALIATTLVTASAIPKMNKLFHSELSIVAKHAKTDKMNANVVRTKAVTDKVIKEDDIDKHGQLNVESHNYMNNFEIAAGVVGCSGDDRIETFSVQTGHCWDGIVQALQLWFPFVCLVYGSRMQLERCVLVWSCSKETIL